MKIDKGIPLTGVRGSGGRNAKYPFRDMGVGDSIFMPGASGKSMAGAAWVFAFRNPEYRLATRAVEEGGIKGVRVWRLESVD